MNDPWDYNTSPIDATGTGTRYDLGGGNNDYTNAEDVPWDSLEAGDVVNVWPGTYPLTCRISGQGTQTNKIVINGVVVNGSAPTFTGLNAPSAADITLENWSTYADFVEGLGVFILFRSQSDTAPHKPSHITFQNLKIEGAKYNTSYTAVGGGSKLYATGAAAVYAPGAAADDILVQNCEITGNSNGLFCNSTGADTTQSGTSSDSVSINWTIRGNKIHLNGNASRDREHNLYIQCENPIYEGNWIGPLVDGALGSAVKDRSSGTIIRYNTIYSAARLLDIVDSEGAFGYFATSDLDKYDSCHIYGNILINDWDAYPDGPHSGASIHWGGDTGVIDPLLTRSIAHLGTMYFFYNTVIIRADNTDVWNYRLFDSEFGNTFECRNNIFNVLGTTNWHWMSGDGTGDSTLNMESANLFYAPNISSENVGLNGTPTMNNNDTRYTTNPDLIDAYNSSLLLRNFNIDSTNDAQGNAVTLPTSFTNFPVNKMYKDHYDSETRNTNVDIGALEN